MDHWTTLSQNATVVPKLKRWRSGPGDYSCIINWLQHSIQAPFSCYARQSISQQCSYEDCSSFVSWNDRYRMLFTHNRSCWRAFQNSLPSWVWNILGKFISHSPKTWLLWKEQTSTTMPSYSPTRWWSRWEMFDQVMVQFRDVVPFLHCNEDIAPATKAKLLSFSLTMKKV